jgi:hypothetical protein
MDWQHCLGRSDWSSRCHETGPGCRKAADCSNCSRTGCSAFPGVEVQRAEGCDLKKDCRCTSARKLIRRRQEPRRGSKILRACFRSPVQHSQSLSHRHCFTGLTLPIMDKRGGQVKCHAEATSAFSPPLPRFQKPSQPLCASESLPPGLLVATDDTGDIGCVP